MPIVDRQLSINQSGEVEVLDAKTSKQDEKKDILRLNKKYNILSESDETFKLKAENISFHYKKSSLLIDGLNLSTQSGEVVVLKGENGKGKSTLFKILAGLQKPIHGKLTIMKNIKVLNMKKYQKEIGFIFQNPETHFYFDTINEEFKNINDKIQLNELCTLFLKDIDLNRSPFLLSEGEKRRLTILMTFMMNKSFMFYDEPTFGQDHDSIKLIADLIMYIKSKNKIQFIISHDEEFIKLVADKVYQLENLKLKDVTGDLLK